MIITTKIYYDPATGDIIGSTTGEFAMAISPDWIEQAYDSTFNISKWKVDLSTKELVKIEP